MINPCNNPLSTSYNRNCLHFALSGPGRPLFLGAVVLIAMLFWTAGCSNTGDAGKDAGKGNIVASINDYSITLSEFNTLIKQETEADPEFDLTQDNTAEFLDYLIRKQLLIQEAAKLKLDREEDFIRTIERYWESTLIRNLLTLKTEEMKKKVLVTDNEILAYYNENRDETSPPLTEIKDDLRQQLETQKNQALIEAWTRSLKESATIKKNLDLFTK